MSNSQPSKEMKKYALDEMISLLKNMQTRPVQCYSQKIRGQETQYFLGSLYIKDLIDALKKQYA